MGVVADCELIAKYGEEVYPLVDSYYFHNMPLPEGQESVILINEAKDFGRLAVDDTFRRYGLITKVPRGIKEALRSQVRTVGRTTATPITKSGAIQ